MKGHDITWDLQLTLTQKSLYPNYTQLFGALCDACCSQAGPGDLMQSTRYPWPWHLLSIRVGSEWAEKQMPIHHEHTLHLPSASRHLNAHFISKRCVRAGWMDRVRVSFVGSQWGYIHLQMCVLVCGGEGASDYIVGERFRFIKWRLLCRREPFTGRSWMCSDE